jgi:hypothetical protein
MSTPYVIQLSFIIGSFGHYALGSDSTYCYICKKTLEGATFDPCIKHFNDIMHSIIIYNRIIHQRKTLLVNYYVYREYGPSAI